MPATRIEMRPGGCALLIMDQPGRPVNTLAGELLDELALRLEQLAKDNSVRAVVLASAKKTSFVAGADLKALAQAATAAQATASLAGTSRTLDIMVDFAKPLVAAVHGAVLGGGLGLALCCQRIVAARARGLIFGFPAVRLGFIPAGGIPGRLLERVGPSEAIPLLITAENISPARAMEIGLIDALVDPDELLDQAAEDALALADGSLSPAQPHQEPLDPDMLQAVRASVIESTRGLLPAPLAVVEGLEIRAQHGPEAARKREDELFGELVASPQSRNLVWHFQASNSLKKTKPGEEARLISRLGVVGATGPALGIVPTSLAFCPVAVWEPDVDNRTRLEAMVRTVLEKLLKRGRINGGEMHARLERLNIGEEPQALAGCDFVLDLNESDVQQAAQTLSQLTGVAQDGAVLASRSPVPPLDQAAKGIPGSERVVGLRLFEPVHRSPLVEIVRGESTAAWAVDTAAALASSLGKGLVFTQNGPGSVSGRLRSVYIAEAVMLMHDGATASQIDETMLAYGFAKGPLAMRGEAPVTPGGSAMSPEEIIQRMTMILANSAAAIFSAGMVASAADLELLAVHGLGYPAFYGGPLHLLQEMGPEAAMAALEDMAAKHGKRFAPDPRIRAFAEDGQGFF